MKIGIVGCGLIGNKRASAIRTTGIGEIIRVCDVDSSRAQKLAVEYATKADTDWRAVVDDPRIEAVIVATPNIFLKDISIAALESGKHVLCEKPLGRNAGEAEAIWRAARSAGRILKTGFNHRHHPAVWKARGLVEKGKLGELYFIRCIYGHGGRPGYENEWRANREICGGGELLDQGVHVVDLFRWFMGEFVNVFGYTRTYSWPVEVEDNAFAMFKTAKGQVAQMHTSWAQWKNKFLFEVFGERGYALVVGLGGSYGMEKLIIGRRKTTAEFPAGSDVSRTRYLGGAPEEEVIEFSGPDVSWENEWREFVSAVREGREPLGSGYDGWMANIMIEAVYASARTDKPAEVRTGIPIVS